jgi:nucleoid-associated protein YgaU
MTSLVQFSRFLVGLGMVIAGGFVAAPLITSILGAAMSKPVPPHNVDRAFQGGTTPSTIHAFTIPSSISGKTDEFRYAHDPSGLSLNLPKETAVPSQVPAELLQRMPERIPEHSLGTATPNLYGAYRTTVEMPPPPLLDGSKDIAQHQMERTSKKRRGPRRHTPESIPETYRVQDGDDLTGIATRLYGHPRAASALWQVNANRLSSPEVLPIGFEMVVPPAWRVFGKSSVYGNAHRIEPTEETRMEVPRGATIHATSMPKENFDQPYASTPNQATGSPWLGRAPELHSIYPDKTITAQSRGTIRVAPGETLASLAQRVYGNANMADSIFNANRDRLRSPALLVPGTELRLP